MSTHTAISKPVEQPPAATPEPSPSGDDSSHGEPAPAVTLRFHLGELTATPEAVAAAHASGVGVIEAVLRHLGGDWGDIDDATAVANDMAVATGGVLRSAYRLPGTADTLVVTTDGERRHTTASLASQHHPGLP
jgi:hypothetical protein